MDVGTNIGKPAKRANVRTAHKNRYPRKNSLQGRDGYTILYKSEKILQEQVCNRYGGVLP